jgi:hypothetical protein
MIQIANDILKKIAINCISIDYKPKILKASLLNDLYYLFKIDMLVITIFKNNAKIVDDLLRCKLLFMLLVYLISQ